MGMSGPIFSIAPLPIKTDRTLRAVPYVTYALCFLCLFVHLATLRLSEYDFTIFTRHFGFIVEHPTPVALATYGFLHADIFHLVGNLLILWLVGTVLEAGIGSPVFLLLYLAGQVTAVLLYGLIGKAFLPGELDLPLVGASGAIAGVTGFAAFRYYRLRILTIPLIAWPALGLPVPIPIPLWLPMWSYAVLFAGREMIEGITLITQGSGSNVAHWAHIGGLLLGALAALALNAAGDGKRESVLEDTVKQAGTEKPSTQSLWEAQQLLHTRPDDPEVLEATAALLLAKGQREQGRALYLKSIPLFLADAQPKRAAISYLNVLRAFPETVFPPREQMRLATSLEEQGHYPEALQAFTLLHAHYPDHEEAQTALLRAAHLQHRRLDDPDAAAALLQTLLQTYPATPWRELARQRLADLARYVTQA